MVLVDNRSVPGYHQHIILRAGLFLSIEEFNSGTCLESHLAAVKVK